MLFHTTVLTNKVTIYFLQCIIKQVEYITTQQYDYSFNKGFIHCIINAYMYLKTVKWLHKKHLQMYTGKHLYYALCNTVTYFNTLISYVKLTVYFCFSLIQKFRTSTLTKDRKLTLKSNELNSNCAC